MQKASQLSSCRTYRYALDRIWDPHLPALLWVLYNPSTADETEDDPTLRRCIHFSQAWGYGGLRIVNLYSLRSPHPATLKDHPAPNGPDHDTHVQKALSTYKDVICAWGLQGGPISSHFSPGTHRIFHLGLNRDGSPKHPLYLPSTTSLLEWP